LGEGAQPLGRELGTENGAESGHGVFLSSTSAQDNTITGCRC
jgi:hypothetical protein